MKWNGEEFFRAYKKALAVKLEMAVAKMQAWAKDHVNRQGSKWVHSAAGEYPMRQSGHLIKNLPYEVDKDELVARFGTNVEYGKFLETGTSKVAARPWLTLTIKGTRKAVADILKKPILTKGGK
jgi:phage gpG-like protein